MFGMFHGTKAHLFIPGAKAEVVYKGKKLLATIAAHNGRHHVKVTLDQPVLEVTVTVTKRLFRQDLVTESAKWISQLCIWEDNVKPLES